MPRCFATPPRFLGRRVMLRAPFRDSSRYVSSASTMADNVFGRWRIAPGTNR
jgi:hypothetical protein